MPKIPLSYFPPVPHSLSCSCVALRSLYFHALHAAPQRRGSGRPTRGRATGRESRALSYSAMLPDIRPYLSLYPTFLAALPDEENGNAKIRIWEDGKGREARGDPQSALPYRAIDFNSNTCFTGAFPEISMAGEILMISRGRNLWPPIYQISPNALCDLFQRSFCPS